MATPEHVALTALSFVELRVGLGTGWNVLVVQYAYGLSMAFAMPMATSNIQ